MNETKLLQSSAFFMIALIIGIPFYVSEVYAVPSVVINKAAGVEGIDGFTENQDTLKIEATASISDSEDVESGKLRVYYDSYSSYVLFDVCTPLNGSSNEYYCIYTRDLFSARGTHDYRVELHTGATQYDDNAQPVDTATATVTVDAEGASVKTLQVIPNRSITGQVNVRYYAEDYGINKNDKQYCSGVNRIEFYEGDYSGSAVHTIDTSNLCMVSGNFSYLSNQVNGQITLCAKAYDLLNQSQIENVCTVYYIDNQGPSADIGSLIVMDQDTEVVLDYIGTNLVMSIVTLEIPAVDLDVSTLHTDLSSLAGATFTDVTPFSHSFLNGTYLFTWKNVPVGNVVSCSVTVTASDFIGNNATTVLPCPVKVDNSGPEVSLITTTAILDDIYYMGKVGTLAAKITEKGIGLNDSEVYMDLSNINKQSRVKADECVHIEGDKWECYWYKIIPSVGDGEYYVSVYKESMDDLGNIMADKYEQLIGVDRTSPSINQDIIFDVMPSVTEVPYQNITIAGDVLEFVVAVTDAYSATADFSGIGGLSDSLPESCWKENGTMWCRWIVPVMASGPYNTDVEFNFMDFAGNSNSISKTIEIAGLDNESNPQYWTTTVSCSPSLLDRETLGLINQKSFCEIKLRPTNPEASIEEFSMDIYPNSCSLIKPDNGTLTDYINNVQLMNNQRGTSGPFMDITFATGEFNIVELQFSCVFRIFTKVGDTYTLHPENENVTGTFEFYNNPLGTVDQAYLTSVNDAIDKVDELGEWLITLTEWFDYAKRFCELVNTLTNMVAILTAISGFLNVASQGYSAFDGAWVGTCGATKAAEGTITGTIMEFTEPICSFINCKWSDELLNGEDGKGGKAITRAAAFISGEGGVDVPDAFDVKQSIVWSIATICIPGVVYNLAKYQQIQCQYATCLMRDVPVGYGKELCEENKAALLCQFFWGQIFNALPFMQIFSNIMAKYQELFSDPLATIGWLINILLGCSNALCTPGQQSYELVCSIFAAVSMVGKAVGDINGIQEQGFFDTIGESACQVYMDEKDIFESDDGTE